VCRCLFSFDLLVYMAHPCNSTYGRLGLLIFLCPSSPWPAGVPVLLLLGLLV
jgi:hypothetical protein